MKYYIEIKIHPTPEATVRDITSAIFQGIHQGIRTISYNLGNNPIGISFPEYIAQGKTFSLGRTIRLFSPDKESLEALQLKYLWLSKLQDYLVISDIMPVPETITGYAVYVRKVSHRATPLNLAKRYAKRHGETLTEALKRFPKEKKFYPFPSISIFSTSTKKKYWFYIEKVPLSTPCEGSFSNFGLSATATVPEF